MKISGMVKSCLKIYSACNSSVPLQLRAKIYSGPAVRWDYCMKITHGVTNLMGMVHGGMLYALADVVTGLTARADGRKYVTQSAHINFIRNVSEGTVYAKGILIRRGRSITIVRSEVTDEKGDLLADVTVDMFCLGE